MVYNISYSAVKILRRKEVGQTMNQDIPRKYLHEKPGACPSNGESPVGAVYDRAYFLDSMKTARS